MSEIKDYKPISPELGNVELHFLRLFSRTDGLSAYDIFGDLKGRKPMAYNNVHKRVKRLRELGLIDYKPISEVKKKFRRNAIYYRLTSRGLFERLLTINLESLAYLYLNKDNIILRTLLYRYFEPVTLGKFKETASIAIADYLKKCCVAILQILKFSRESVEGFREDIVDYQIEKTIFAEIKNLALRIVISSKNEGRKTFPIPELSKDENFMSVVPYDKKGF